MALRLAPNLSQSNSAPRSYATVPVNSHGGSLPFALPAPPTHLPGLHPRSHMARVLQQPPAGGALLPPVALKPQLLVVPPRPLFLRGATLRVNRSHFISAAAASPPRPRPDESPATSLKPMPRRVEGLAGGGAGGRSNSYWGAKRGDQGAGLTGGTPAWLQMTPSWPTPCNGWNGWARAGWA